MKRWIILICLITLFRTGYAQFNLYLENQLSVPAEEVTAIKISKDGRFIAFGDMKGILRIRDILANRLLHELKAHRGSVQALVFDNNQQRLVSGGRDGTISIWDLYSGQREKQLKDVKAAITDLTLFSVVPGKTVLFTTIT